MLLLQLSKDVSKRSKAKNKGSGKETPRDCAGYVLSLLIYRGREQDGQGRESGDKGTGSGKF